MTGAEEVRVLTEGTPAEVLALLGGSFPPQEPRNLRLALMNAFGRIGALEAELERTRATVQTIADLDVADAAELLGWLHEFTEDSPVGKDFVWRVVQLLRYLDSRLPPLPTP